MSEIRLLTDWPKGRDTRGRVLVEWDVTSGVGSVPMWHRTVDGKRVYYNILIIFDGLNRMY